MLIKKLLIQTLNQSQFFDNKKKLSKNLYTFGLYTFIIINTLSGINKNKSLNSIKKSLSKQYLNKFYHLLDNYWEDLIWIKISTDKTKILLKKIEHYKGYRIIARLPLNGQRTHTNAKTNKKIK